MMIWLVGHKGMLGSEVHKLLIERGMPCLASDLEVDITDIHRLRAHVMDRPLSWIINCSAYTAVDRAEDERELAFQINSDGVRNIALIAAEKKAKLIHISTDYVFDGTKEDAYLETDPPNPPGVYGASKYEGEKHVQASLSSYFIFRTAWLYGRSGNNFVHTMIRLFREREEIRVVADQWGSPTWPETLPAPSSTWSAVMRINTASIISPMRAGPTGMPLPRRSINWPASGGSLSRR